MAIAMGTRRSEPIRSSMACLEKKDHSARVQRLWLLRAPTVVAADVGAGTALKYCCPVESRRMTFPPFALVTVRAQGGVPSPSVWVDQIALAAAVPFPLYSTALQACAMRCQLSPAAWTTHGCATASCRCLCQGGNPECVRSMSLQTCIVPMPAYYTYRAHVVRRTLTRPLVEGQHNSIKV